MRQIGEISAGIDFTCDKCKQIIRKATNFELYLDGSTIIAIHKGCEVRNGR